MRITRYDLHGSCYGETILSNKSVRQCLEYLKEIFSRNPHLGVTRSGYTFEKITKGNIYHYAIVRDR